MNRIAYKDFIITRDDAPYTPYSFAAEDFDGAPDANDKRYGHGRSVRDCLDQIDFLIEENDVPEEKGLKAMDRIIRGVKLQIGGPEDGEWVPDLTTEAGRDLAKRMAGSQGCDC